jgi:hypothetical protein
VSAATATATVISFLIVIIVLPLCGSRGRYAFADVSHLRDDARVPM